MRINKSQYNSLNESIHTDGYTDGRSISTISFKTVGSAKRLI